MCMVSLVRLVLGVVMSVPCRLRFVNVDNNTPMVCLYKVVLLILTIVLTIIKMFGVCRHIFVRKTRASF